MSVGELEAFFFRALTVASRLPRLVLPTHEVEPVSPPALAAFPLDAQRDARRMAAHYELLYCLENSMRELIESTLSENLGPEKWWHDGVPENIRRSAEKRRADDDRARWHGPRGTSLIVYTDFPQLAEIILARWNDFESLLGDKRWVESYVEEVNRTRRALAHTGALSDLDVERFDLRVREWLRVVG